MPVPDFDDVIIAKIAIYISGKVFANTRQEVELGHEQHPFQIFAPKHFHQSHRALQTDMIAMLAVFDNHVR